MPHSGPEFESMFSRVVGALKPSRVLDVGVGAGKIGRLVKAAHPESKIVGIEAEPKYRNTFEAQWGIYEKVHTGDAKDVSLALSHERFDLVVFGDVLEHMWKHDALALLEYWVARSAFVVAIWPIGFPQDAVREVSSEIHRCELSLVDLVLAAVPVVRFHKFERAAPGQFKCFAVIRGVGSKREMQPGVVY